MRRRIAACAALLVALHCTQGARAGEFQRAFEAAERDDPTYRAARQELAGALQGVPVAHAALLPNASLNLSDAHVTGSRTAPNIFGQPVTSALDYRSPQQSLSMRIPVLNRDATKKYQQAETQALLAAAQLAVRRYELLERLGQAYLQRLYAEQGVSAATSQLTAAREQSRLAARRMDLGEGTGPDKLQAEADLALAQAQLLEARNQASAATFVLTQLVGRADMAGAPAAPYTLPPLQPPQLETWQERAANDSPALAARRHAVEVARLGVERATAGHYPRLDVVASVAHSRNELVSTLNQATRQQSLGLQFNLPLYAGGGVDASVAQAVAEHERTQALLEAEQQDLQADIQRLFLTAQSGLARVGALQQAREAGSVLVRAARMAMERGLGTQAEVLRAESKLVDSARDVAKAQYDHLLTLLRLHTRAGVPADEIARLLDSVLSPT